MVYAAGNVIDGQYLLLLAVMAIIGGYVGCGAGLSYFTALAAWFIVIVGLAMALGLFHALSCLCVKQGFNNTF